MDQPLIQISRRADQLLIHTFLLQSRWTPPPFSTSRWIHPFLDQVWLWSVLTLLSSVKLPAIHFTNFVPQIFFSYYFVPEKISRQWSRLWCGWWMGGWWELWSSLFRSLGTLPDRRLQNQFWNSFINHFSQIPNIVETFCLPFQNLYLSSLN